MCIGFEETEIVQDRPSSATTQHSCNRNRKLQISRAPTKATSQEPDYSQALNQNKIVRQRSRSGESGRQADGQMAMVDGAWS